MEERKMKKLEVAGVFLAAICVIAMLAILARETQLIEKATGKWTDGVVTATFNRDAGTLVFSGNGAVANTEEWLKMSYRDRARVRTLIFERKITNIWNYEFEYDNRNGYPNLQKVLFKQDIGEIGRGAFSDNVNLSTVWFDGGCKSIDAYAFDDCSNLCEVNIPDGCHVDDGAFMGTPMEARFMSEEPDVPDAPDAPPVDADW